MKPSEICDSHHVNQNTPEIADREVYFEGRREENKGEYEEALFFYAYASAQSNDPVYSAARDRVYAILVLKMKVKRGSTL